MEILVFGLSVFSISFFIAYINTSYNLKKTSSMLTETLLLYMSSFENKDDVKQDNPEEIHRENFIKFLSDSRDWAYEYIENVQKSLREFVEEVEPSIKFFNEYGTIAQGSPHYKDMMTISNSFEKIKKLLPEEIDDRR